MDVHRGVSNVFDHSPEWLYADDHHASSAKVMSMTTYPIGA
jgi:hypothetical protein